MTSRPATGPHPGAPQVRHLKGAATPPIQPEQPPIATDEHSLTPEHTSPTGKVQTDPITADAAPADLPALVGDAPVERHRLARMVTRYWRWRIVFSAFPILVLLAGLAIVVPLGEWWMRWGVVGVALILLIVAMVILPPIRYRVFWYAISPTEIDVQHGVIFIKRSVVPMHRVQSLRTERGPMADHYSMTNLKIRTAAGSVNLSGLDRHEADELCDRISRLADVADDV